MIPLSPLRGNDQTSNIRQSDEVNCGFVLRQSHGVYRNSPPSRAVSARRRLVRSLLAAHPIRVVLPLQCLSRDHVGEYPECGWLSSVSFVVSGSFYVT